MDYWTGLAFKGKFNHKNSSTRANRVVGTSVDARELGLYGIWDYVGLKHAVKGLSVIGGFLYL